jgi:hypothetical protein
MRVSKFTCMNKIQTFENWNFSEKIASEKYVWNVFLEEKKGETEISNLVFSWFSNKIFFVSQIVNSPVLEFKSLFKE